jgi:hypothetical protein
MKILDMADALLPTPARETLDADSGQANLRRFCRSTADHGDGLGLDADSPARRTKPAKERPAAASYRR